MRSQFSFLIATLFSMLIPISAQARCTEKDLEPGWLWSFDGTIGEKYRVRATLMVTDSGLAGVYFYSTQLKDIRLAGRFIDGSRIVLDELDAAGKVTARFEGEFPERDPHGGFGAALLHCEVIVGSWHKIEGAERLPVYLSEVHGTSGTLAHRYAVAGVSDDELVHRTAQRFWTALINGDKPTVASLIKYPIRVHVAGRVRSVRTSQELISQYETVFSMKFREAIAAALPRNMFARD